MVCRIYATWPMKNGYSANAKDGNGEAKLTFIR